MIRQAVEHLKHRELLLDDDDEFLEFDFIDNVLDAESDEASKNCTKKVTKKTRWQHMRLNWFDHVTKLSHEKMFEREYRMSFDAWNCLNRIMKNTMSIHPQRSWAHEPILIEIKIASSLRILFGGAVNDIREIFGISNSAQYYIFANFLDSVIRNKHLAIKLPTIEELPKVNHGFTKKSFKGIINGCAGALDGFFQKTTAPIVKEVGNIIAYYSGHYESYGLNCQAMCDSDLRFLFFGVVAPGSTNDNIAFFHAKGLAEFINSLPPGLYVVGDAAYTVTEKLLTPFVGAQKSDKSKDAFNFYLSQLRIRIEMAFGLLTNKFRILKKPLEKSTSTNSKILLTCAMLHNYIINHKLGKFSNECNNSNTSNNLAQASTDNNIEDQNPNDSTDDFVDVDDYGDNIYGEDIEREMNAPMCMTYYPVIPDEDFKPVQGISITRDYIVEVMETNEFRRPEYNKQRNKEKPDKFRNVHCNYFHPR